MQHWHLHVNIHFTFISKPNKSDACSHVGTYFASKEQCHSSNETEIPVNLRGFLFNSTFLWTPGEGTCLPMTQQLKPFLEKLIHNALMMRIIATQLNYKTVRKSS